jgi:hypothetical protein
LILDSLIRRGIERLERLEHLELERSDRMLDDEAQYDILLPG